MLTDMRILMATPIYPPEIGGPATYTVELAKRLKGEHEIVVLAFADNAEQIEGTRLVAISKRHPLPVRLLRFFFAALAEVRRADAVYVQNAVAAGLPIALACRILRKKFTVKFVGDEAWERARLRNLTHKRLEEFLKHPEGDWKIRLLMRIQKYVLQRAAYVTTPSAYLREEIIRHYHVRSERAIINYNAADAPNIALFAAKPHLHQIAVTARLVMWKGIDGVIRATALLLKRFPDIRLMVAGEGPEEQKLRALSNSVGINDHVTFLGQISRAETWHLRKNSAVYVLNSTYEGLPHTALTSFAARIPIIATDISGTNEAVYHEETGLLVPPNDDAALAQAIERIFTDASLRSRLVENASRLLEEKFSWGAHIETLTSLFHTMRPEPRHKS